MYEHVHTCIYSHTHTHMHAVVYMYMYTHTTHVHLHMHTCNTHSHMYMYNVIIVTLGHTAVSAHILRGHLDTPQRIFSKGKISIATGTLRNAITLQPLPFVNLAMCAIPQDNRGTKKALAKSPVDF